MTVSAFARNRALRWAAIMALACGAALSDAQSPAASDAIQPPIAPGTPATVPGATGGPLPAATSPAGAVVPPEVPGDANAKGAPTTAERQPLIALVLPLQAAAYARAADAVRAGFMAAAQVAGIADRCLVLPHDEDGVIGAFEQADARGARVVVGPLVRDDLKTIAIAGLALRPTIALNQLDDGSPLPPNMYSLALAIESDAKVLAQRALADGIKSLDVVAAETPLMRRLAVSFASEWVGGGGSAPSEYRVDASTESLVALRRTLLKVKPDALLLALEGDRIALAKPFLGPVLSYASGLSFDRLPQRATRDLNDVRVVDIPWIVTPDAPEFAGLPRADYANAALLRLYALGLDAFRVAFGFTQESPQRMELDGATGHLTLNAQRQFTREGRLAIYRDGQLVPLEPR